MKIHKPCIFAASFFSLAGAFALASEAEKPQPPEKPKAEKGKYVFKVAEASDEGELAIKKFKAAENLKIELFAAEPMVANPVAMCVDEKGRFYVAETFREGEGVIDIRGYMDWLDEDIASRTIDDRLANAKRHLGKETEAKMGIASERIHLIEDRDGDGKADYSSVFATGFDSILDGVAAGILARKGNIYFANIPNFWLLRDDKGAGYATTRKVLHTGYGVRNAFMGHDLHGVKMGPDGRIYFSIGDRGANVKTEGRYVQNIDCGCVFRCNLDGSNLEIYATGLRNPQSLAFDKYGNLFTGDNNSDGGDKARFEYLVEGGDYGWRIGYQYITNPSRGPWNAEKLWELPFPGQAAYLLPPIAHITAGPSGIAYFPGTGLPEKYRNNFFLCDFTGGITSSVFSFSLNQKGATFELVNKDQFVKGFQATDVCFGVDGGLYVSDWVEGWKKTGKGRIYRVFETESAQTNEVRDTKRLLAEGFDQRPASELLRLLDHVDMRVRQEAQFALAERTDAGVIPALESVAKTHHNKLARIHALWALEQIARKNPAAANIFPELFFEWEPEIRVQAAKMAGERKLEAAYEGFIRLLENDYPRARYFAAVGLGKLGKREAIAPILNMIRKNDEKDKDAYLRHAAVYALQLINDPEALAAAAKDDSAAVRMVVLLAYRRLENDGVAQFLRDKDPLLVLEAARAINDIPINAAMPELAALIDQPTYSDALLKRVINANFRIGTKQAAEALVRFIQTDATAENLRNEAFAALSDWAKPSQRDRVTNLFRPITMARDQNVATEALKPVIVNLLKSGPERMRVTALKTCDKLNIVDGLNLLHEIVNDSNAPGGQRVEALKMMAARGHAKLNEAVNTAANSGDWGLRREGIQMLGKINSDDAAQKQADLVWPQIINAKRGAITAVAELPGLIADSILGRYMDDVLHNRIERELVFDVLEAAQKRSSPQFKEKLQRFEDKRPKDKIEAQYGETMWGGDYNEGRKVFYEKQEAQCSRCHKAGQQGGDVGPNLGDLALRKDRNYILQAIVDPNKEISAGFESTTIRTNDGRVFAGVLKSEGEKEVVLGTAEGPIKIEKTNIKWQKKGLSPMPEDISKMLNKREIRNLLEFLGNQRTPPEPPKKEGEEKDGEPKDGEKKDGEKKEGDKKEKPEPHPAK